MQTQTAGSTAPHSGSPGAGSRHWRGSQAADWVAAWWCHLLATCSIGSDAGGQAAHKPPQPACLEASSATASHDATAQRQSAHPLTVRVSPLQVARLLTQLIEDNRSQSEARSQIIWSQQRQLEARQKRNRLKQVCPAPKAAWSAAWVVHYQLRQLEVCQFPIKKHGMLQAACRPAFPAHARHTSEHSKPRQASVGCLCTTPLQLPAPCLAYAQAAGGVPAAHQSKAHGSQATSHFSLHPCGRLQHAGGCLL